MSDCYSVQAEKVSGEWEQVRVFESRKNAIDFARRSTLMHFIVEEFTGNGNVSRGVIFDNLRAQPSPAQLENRG